MNNQIFLLQASGVSVTLQIKKLNLSGQNGNSSECCCTFQISSKFYSQIHHRTLFNLKPELYRSLNTLEFDHEADFEIEAVLQPQLLPQLVEHAINSESAIAYLVACSQEIAVPKRSKKRSKQTLPAEINPLLLTESWYALRVTQKQEAGEIGYRTFWSYLNPTNLTPESIASGQFSEAMAQFLKDRDEGNRAIAEQAVSTVIEEIANDIKNWDETETVKQTEAAITEFFSDLTDAFESWTEPIRGSGKGDSANGKLYQAMLNFFSEEDWEFTKLQGQLILRLAFQGRNGQWNCFAIVNETQQRFLFYSICPLEIPSENRSAIAEFLSRANHGMEIGNFEFNFDAGEISCKTSFDVTGIRETSVDYLRLAAAFIKHQVYTNVLTMDQYLPGIQLVLDGTAPIEAIRAIEQPS